MINALLFDLYDTLAMIDAQAHFAVKAEMSSRVGAPPDKFLEVWKRYTPICALGDVLTLEERVARVMRDLKLSPKPELVREVASLEYKLQTKDVRLSENVVDSLEYFRASGIKLGLVTNAPSYMRGVPQILGIERFFDAVIFSYTLGVLKPDPRIYLAACSSLQVKPYECMFIGDGNDRELDGAAELGMVAVRIGGGRDAKLRGVVSQTSDYFVDTVDELKEIVYDLRKPH
jgi:putative hydrolase of the HAD superfamily